MKKLLITALLSFNLFGAPQVGDNAINFKLPSLYHLNQQISSDAFKGHVVLLNLWASWCNGCQEEMPLFVALQKEFQDENFKIVLSSIDQDPNNAIDFLKDVDSDKVLTSLYDTKKILPKAYRCIGMPSSFLIDKNGKIVKIFVGSLDADAIQNLKSEVHKLLGK